MWNSAPKNNSCSSTDGAHSCCSPQPSTKAPCPQCTQSAKAVSAKTLSSLLSDEAKGRLERMKGFHFCANPACEVVYFRGDEILTQSDVRVTVGLKEGASPATLCYCFGWSKEKIKACLTEHGKTTALEDIKEKMASVGCSCDTLNPSGECCLGDVAKAIKALQHDPLNNH